MAVAPDIKEMLLSTKLHFEVIPLGCGEYRIWLAFVMEAGGKKSSRQAVSTFLVAGGTKRVRRAKKLTRRAMENTLAQYEATEGTR